MWKPPSPVPTPGDQQRRELDAAWIEAEARVESATSDRDKMAAELDALRQTIDTIPVEAFAEDETVREALIPPSASVRAARQPPGLRRRNRDFDRRRPRPSGRPVDSRSAGALPTALKPNRVIKIKLPLGEGTVVCKGKIVWAQLEPSSAGAARYRAGVCFTTADATAIEAFIARHAPRRRKH
jgi:hypothetical protein